MHFTLCINRRGDAVKKIAVLMTCYNRVGTTLECLRRLFSQEVPNGYSFDVWLVDDASPDKTGEKVRSAYPSVNVIHGTGKLFWCRGMRLAWDNAATAGEYDFYLLLNDDTMLDKGALTVILKDWESVESSRPGIICAPLSNGSGSREISYGAFSYKEYCDLKGRREFDGPVLVHGPTCANMLLVPKVVYNKVGPICSLYHHGFGDYDYGNQVRKNGFVCYSASKVLGWWTANYGDIKDLREIPFFNRLPLLWKPKGLNICDAVVYRYRKDGFFRSVLTAGHILARVLFAVK